MANTPNTMSQAIADAMTAAEFEIQYKAVLWACETSCGHPGQTLREWLAGQDWQGQTVEALAEAWDELDVIPDDMGWDCQND